MLHRNAKTALWVFLLAFLSLGATDSDSMGVRNLSAKLYCDCGCHQVVTECYGKCTRKPVVIKEIAAGIGAKQTDDAILSGMAASMAAQFCSCLSLPGLMRRCGSCRFRLPYSRWISDVVAKVSIVCARAVLTCDASPERFST